MQRGREENRENRITALVLAYEAAETGTFLTEESYHDLIEYYQKGEQFEKALRVARHACTQYRFTTDFYVRQAQLLIITNRSGAAEDILDTALQFAPGDFELNLLLAEVFFRRGEEAAGMALLSPFRENINPQELSDLFLVEAIAYERRADYESMFQALKSALQADWSNERALEGLSLCTDFCDKHDEAVQLYRYILDQNAYHHLAWYFLGHALTELGKNDEALEAYEYAFLASPDFQEGYLAFAEVCWLQRQYNKALETYHEVAERFGTDVYLLLDMGSCYQALERYQDALTCFQRAAVIAPQNAETAYKTGACHAAREEWTAALGFYQKAIRLQPEDVAFHLALAEAAFELDRMKLAEYSYYQALALTPSDHQLWLDLTWFYLETERYDEALEVLHEADDAIDHPELAYTFAACLIAHGRRQEGLTKLATLLTEDYWMSKTLFEWRPQLRTDAEVIAMLEVFRPE